MKKDTKSRMTKEDLVNKARNKAKKEWPKGKVPAKANNAVLFDKATCDKLYKEVPNSKFLTLTVVSLWEIKVLQKLPREGPIKVVSKHRVEVIYTRNTKGWDIPAAGEMQNQVQTSVHLEKKILY